MTNPCQKYEYMLLVRLKQDCQYFIENKGGNLWGITPTSHISKMFELYNQLDEKPIWLSTNEILKFRSDMDEIEKFKNKCLQTKQDFDIIAITTNRGD